MTVRLDFATYTALNGAIRLKVASFDSVVLAAARFACALYAKQRFNAAEVHHSRPIDCSIAAACFICEAASCDKKMAPTSRC